MLSVEFSLPFLMIPSISLAFLVTHQKKPLPVPGAVRHAHACSPLSSARGKVSASHSRSACLGHKGQILPTLQLHHHRYERGRAPFRGNSGRAIALLSVRVGFPGSASDPPGQKPPCTPPTRASAHHGGRGSNALAAVGLSCSAMQAETDYPASQGLTTSKQAGCGCFSLRCIWGESGAKGLPREEEISSCEELDILQYVCVCVCERVCRACIHSCVCVTCTTVHTCVCVCLSAGPVCIHVFA